MKVAELTDALLDYWTAMAGKEWEQAHQYFPTMTLDPTFEGVRVGMFPRGEYGSLVETCILIPRNAFRQDPQPFCPSIWWRQGGPIIERERISLRPGYGGGGLWKAECGNEFYGSEPLIAAMRAYVASKFGDEVPDTEA